jgi:uncharacterized phage protein (TIGR02218 family)
MSLNLSPSIDSSVRKATLSRPALCWEIRPTKHKTSSVFRLTDHPHELTIADGQTYRPQGFDTSALRREAGFKSASKEVVGVISSDDLTDELLRSGILLDARITEYRVDWLFPWKPAVETLKYDVVDLEFDGDQWQATVGNLTSVLDEAIGDYINPRCGVEVFSLGVGKCNKSSTGFSRFRSVSVVIDPYLEFTASNDLDISTIPDLSQWIDGKLLWLTGANTGHESYIRSVSDSDDRTVTLHLPTPSPIEVGDDCTLFVGCNHLLGAGNSVGDCINLFDNGINYQGHPFTPTKDQTIRGISTA